MLYIRLFIYIILNIMHAYMATILYIIGEKVLPEEPCTCSSEASDNNVIIAVVVTLLLMEGINALVIATVVVSCCIVIKYVSY